MRFSGQGIARSRAPGHSLLCLRSYSAVARTRDHTRHLIRHSLIQARPPAAGCRPGFEPAFRFESFQLRLALLCHARLFGTPGGLLRRCVGHDVIAIEALLLACMQRMLTLALIRMQALQSCLLFGTARTRAQCLGSLSITQRKGIRLLLLQQQVAVDRQAIGGRGRTGAANGQHAANVIPSNRHGDVWFIDVYR